MPNSVSLHKWQKIDRLMDFAKNDCMILKTRRKNMKDFRVYLYTIYALYLNSI